MISIDEYFHRHGEDLRIKYELDFSQEYVDNATILLDKVNQLIKIWGGAAWISSGWRPPAVNKEIGGSKKSNHMRGLAVDLADKGGELDAWCMANLKVLEDLGLYMEHPSATPDWCHLQSVPPRSGRRVYYP